MKISDVELGAVYRYTYSGPAVSPLNQHGPWLVGVVTSVDKGTVWLDPVDGLIVVVDRPAAGVELATPDRPCRVHVVRLDGRLCSYARWDEWLRAYQTDRAAAAAVHERRVQVERESVVDLVAALTVLCHDVGRGPWDRSTDWGQFVDDLRRRPLPVIMWTTDAFVSLAGGIGGITDDAHAYAEAWMTAPIS